MENPRYRTVPHVIQVIQITISRGAETSKDWCRFVTQYWTLDGIFLAEFDVITDQEQSNL